MLLVDDHDTQRLELHRLDEQGMGADEDVDLAGAQAGVELGALGRRSAMSQQLDADRTIAEQ